MGGVILHLAILHGGRNNARQLRTHSESRNLPQDRAATSHTRAGCSVDPQHVHGPCLGGTMKTEENQERDEKMSGKAMAVVFAIMLVISGFWWVFWQVVEMLK